MIRVMANGCFDCLHVGHVRHLRAAAMLGDRLIVALTLDEHVNKGPGRPVFNWTDRADMLLSLSCVDEVIPCATGFEAITTYSPDIYVKGIEYVGQNIAEQLSYQFCTSKVIYLRTPAYSSTKILTGELLRERIEAARQGSR